jgi:DNA repair protein RecN (Recombination protein N)
MLLRLSIQNYAIIEQLEISFHPQLNIITGETGAGKSIIIGALNMILGKRADTSVLRDENEKCIVEATFKINKVQLNDFFEDNDLDFEPETTIRREIKPDGKSRAFINDTPVNLNQIKDLTTQLVDLHAQHETQSLLEDTFYLDILDHLANQNQAVTNYKTSFLQYQKQKKKLIAMKENLKQLQANKDFLSFQYQEIADIQLTSEDGQPLEDELNRLENAEEIQSTLAEAVQLLDNEMELNIIQLYSDFSQKLNQLARFGQDFENIHQRVQSVGIELDDIAHEINRLSSNITYDDARLAELKVRQNDINRLLKKHHLLDVEQLMALELDFKTQLDQVNSGEESLEELEQEVASMQTKLFEQATKISSERKRQVLPFKTAVEKILAQIGMPYATIELDHQSATANEMNVFGIDAFDILFSANKGSTPLPLKKVASGGERSRLMLAIKSTIAGNITLPTMVFDEIDTGISGEVAAKVGIVFKTLAKKHQIISITHLPQIAAKADHHLFVYKDHTLEKTATGIKILNAEEQIIEIAKMLSGEKPGAAAVNAAKELMN